MKRTLLPLSFSLVLGLLSGSALGQTAPSAVGTLPAAPAEPTDSYLLGRTYRIETRQGTSFTGVLVSMSLTVLEFDTKEVGHVTLERAQVSRATLEGPAATGTRPGYFDIGNGNRLFFAPTARSLRKGENTLQTVNLFLVGANFGITDNISLGGYVSLIPGIGVSNQFIVLTPKISFPVSDKLHLGVGALYLRIPDFDYSNQSYGAGILYGVATYGSADNNVTAGLGYGFFEGEIGTTPILQLGGQKRVSRRISLISENYIVLDSQAGMGGLYGIKINWKRTSLGLGAAYAYTFPHDETRTYTYYNGTQPVTYTQTERYGGEGFSTYILPVYFDFTFRFGQGVR